MRALFIAYFFPPLGGGGCQRTLKLVRYLEPQGWTSTVITTSARDYWILDPTLLEEIPASTEVVRVGGLTSLRALRILARAGSGVETPQAARLPGAFRSLRALQRWLLVPDGYGGWAQAARKSSEERIEAGGVDALWTTSSPESAHLAGLSLKRRFGIPWVADFRDPWVGRVTYRPPTRWHDRRHRAMERSVVRAADRVTVVSEAMAAHYRARYPEIDPSRFVFLPNGFDSDDWRRAESAESAESAATVKGAPPGADVLRDPVDGGRFVLLHAGQLAHRPTVRTLLEAVRRVITDDGAARRDLRVRFLGGNEELSERERRRYGLGEVLEFVPSRPHIEALRCMRHAAALALLGHGGQADSLLYTGKIYEYLSSGRPVLGIVDEGPGASLIREAKAGPVLRPGNVEGVARSLAGWLAAWRGGTGPTVKIAVELLAAYERRSIAGRAASLLEEIADSPAS